MEYSHRNKNPSKTETISGNTSEFLLFATATWKYVQQHELFRNGLVDVLDVCQRLKMVALCDGSGPVFELGEIRRAIARIIRS
jgi:AP-1-like factor